MKSLKDLEPLVVNKLGWFQGWKSTAPSSRKLHDGQMQRCNICYVRGVEDADVPGWLCTGAAGKGIRPRLGSRLN